MCGISGIFGKNIRVETLYAMCSAQRHRGPDDEGAFVDPSRSAGLAHNRLSILDLSSNGHQPMSDPSGTLWISFNGEVYNYLELRSELADYPFRSRTDTEVVLAAYQRWGDKCLDHLVGMFAFLIWDVRNQSLFGARDRFGVKPFYYHLDSNGTLFVASEIKALHAAGVEREPDAATWATYLASGHYDHSAETFWQGVQCLEPGHQMIWCDGRLNVRCWYDIAERCGAEVDHRSTSIVQEEYRALLDETIRLRFRSDVPVGISLSGGLDSSLLLGLVDSLGSQGRGAKSFTFATGDSNYDELPWVAQMLAHTQHTSHTVWLKASAVPALAKSVMWHQDEPFGGLPSVAYAQLFEEARGERTIVVLDGQGMDEQWAGYDYYSKLNGTTDASLLQGTSQRPVRPECLTPEFRALARPFEPAHPFPDRLRNLQYRDIRYTKIPKALRFNDRVSMRSSVELREPFLDHRLFELALRQPEQHKIVGSTRKWLLRKLASELIPRGVTEAPKRPLQTPQREWLRGPLREWAVEARETALNAFGGDWLDASSVRNAVREFDDGLSDNSFFVWQWISLGMTAQMKVEAAYA